jgi:hypothetical protein
VARAVYGPDNPRWLIFRHWLFNDSPQWFKNFYLAHGERFANWIQDKPLCKKAVRLAMDAAIASQSVGSVP